MKTRYWFIWLLALALGVTALGRMAYFAGRGGEALRQEALRIASVHGELSAIRGRILNEDGKPLAWSVRRYDLRLNPASEQELSAIRGALVRHFGENWGNSGQFAPGILKYDLTASELETVDEICRQYPVLEIELTWERCYDESADRDELGEVRQENGMEIGISGVEAEFEETLRGTPGRFSVMVDRNGRWLDATYRMEQDPEAGNDVILEVEAQ